MSNDVAFCGTDLVSLKWITESEPLKPTAMENGLPAPVCVVPFLQVEI